MRREYRSKFHAYKEMRERIAVREAKKAQEEKRREENKKYSWM